MRPNLTPNSIKVQLLNDFMNGRHIIMADDDADDRFLVKAALEDNRIKNPFVFFEDGENLLNYLFSIKDEPLPALLLLDLNMPKRDGRETLKLLRKDNRWKCIPIIIFSTSNAPEDIYSSYQLGADCYIIKPSNYEGLKQVLMSICKFWLGKDCEMD
ncbi:response regulator [Dyadobacter helix]|nr:response regulator [Dyadobacter sp. CECT 9275]